VASTRTRVATWLALASIHLAAGAWAWVAGNDRLAEVVAGSIYLPLWPFGELGVPVFRQTGWMLPPLTYLGWLIIALFWLVAYWYVAALVAWFISRRTRAA